MIYENMTDAELIRQADYHDTTAYSRALAERLDMRQQPQSVFHDQAYFMMACGQTTTEPNTKQSDMYLELIKEEGEELVVALEQCDVVEELDAIIDLLVVIIGYGLSRGFPMVEAWDEVLRSNMAKIDPLTGTVRKREDGKILKPAGWTAPDIARVIADYAAI